MRISNEIAFATFLLSMGVVAGVTILRGVGPLLYITEHWIELISASIVMSVFQVRPIPLFSWVSYRCTGRSRQMLIGSCMTRLPLSIYGVTERTRCSLWEEIPIPNYTTSVFPSSLSVPSLTHPDETQWFIGRSLNPSLGSLDIKSFNELRPGMILWAIIDFAMVAKQYNDLGRVTDSMWLVVVFHTWYVVDALYNEVSPPLPSTYSALLGKRLIDGPR